MALNQECIRDILIYVDEHPVRSSDGSIKRGMHFRTMLSDESFSGTYSLADINTSIVYLAEKKLIHCANPRDNTRQIECRGLTAKGLEYLQVIKDETIWTKLNEKFGTVFKDSALVAIQTMLTYLLSRIQ